MAKPADSYNFHKDENGYFYRTIRYEENKGRERLLTKYRDYAKNGDGVMGGTALRGVVMEQTTLGVMKLSGTILQGVVVRGTALEIAMKI